MIQELAMHVLAHGPIAAGAGSTGGSTLTQVFTGIAALIGAYSAYRLTKRDSNEDILKDTRRELSKAKSRVDDLEADMLDLRQYIFRLRAAYAAQGIDTPEPPTLRSDHRGDVS